MNDFMPPNQHMKFGRNTREQREVAYIEIQKIEADSPSSDNCGMKFVNSRTLLI